MATTVEEPSFVTGERSPSHVVSISHFPPSYAGLDNGAATEPPYFSPRLRNPSNKSSKSTSSPTLRHHPMKSGGGSTACSSASSTSDPGSSLDEVALKTEGDAPNYKLSADSTHSEQGINDNAIPKEDISIDPPKGSSSDVDCPKGDDIHKPDDPPPILEGKNDDADDDGGINNAYDEEDNTSHADSSQVSTVGRLITTTTTGIPAGPSLGDCGANLLKYQEKRAFNRVATQTFDIASHDTRDINHMAGSESEDLTPWGEWNNTEIFPVRSEGNEPTIDSGDRNRLSTGEESDSEGYPSHTVVKLARLPTAQEIDDLDNRIKEANRKLLRERKSMLDAENALRELMSQRVKVYKGEVASLDPIGAEDDDETDSSDASPEAFDMSSHFDTDSEDASQQGIAGETLESKKSTRTTELTDEESEDVMDSVGIAKCGICGKKIPLDGDQMEEHIMACEAKLESHLSASSQNLKNDCDHIHIAADHVHSYAAAFKKSKTSPLGVNSHMEEISPRPEALPGSEASGQKKGSQRTVSADAAPRPTSGRVTQTGKTNLIAKVKTSISKFAFGRKGAFVPRS